MIGDFIIDRHLESKLRILQGKGTELDRIEVEVFEMVWRKPTDEFDIDTMIKEIKVPKLELRVPESWIE